MLYTKSIQAHKEKKDNIRICIMRRPDAWAKYDIWMPTLAPSNELLDAYHEKKVSWPQFEKRFHKEVVAKQGKYIRLLSEISTNTDVTILCWEKTPEKCHRRLVAEACRQINSKLQVVLH